MGVSNPFVTFAFRAMPGLFDALVRPLMRLAGLSRDHVGPTPGNVLEPTPSGEDVRGGWID